jgi:hypothetical protein
MKPARSPRTVTENVPSVKYVTHDKGTPIAGKRRFRPGCERLEQREVLSTVASSNVGGVLASFSLTGGVLSETRGPHVGVIGRNVQGLFQAKDSTGHQVVYDEIQNMLDEFTPSGWVYTGLWPVSQVAIDSTGDLSARLSNEYLFSLNDARPSYVASGVTAMAVDSAGELVALQGNTSYFYTEGGLESSGGTITSNGARPTYAIDCHGNLYTLLNETLTSVSSSFARSEPVATGVTQMEMTPGGAVIVLEGPHTYAVFGAVIGSMSSSPGDTFALDGSGNLYTLQGSTLTGPGGGVAATGITQLATNPGGWVIVLEGPHAYSTFDNGIGTTSRSPGATYALDGAGDLYTLQGGTLSGPGGSGPNSVLLTGVTQMATTPAGTVIVLQGPHSYSTFNAGIGTTSSSPGATYVLVGAGHLYTLEGGLLTGPGGSGPNSVLFTNVLQMFTLSSRSNVVFLSSGLLFEITSGGLSWVGQSGTYASDGSIWFLGVTRVDRAGDYSIYRFSNGQLDQIPGEAAQLTRTGSALYAQTAAGGTSLVDGVAPVGQAGSIILSGGQIQLAGLHHASNAVVVTRYVPPDGFYLVDTPATVTVQMTSTLNGLSLTPLVYRRTFLASQVQSVSIASGAGETNSIYVPAGIATQGFPAVTILGLPGGSPQTTNTCGPNSAWRVMQAYGGAATYQDLINLAGSSSPISSLHMGTTGAALVDAMNSDRRGYNVPVFSLHTHQGVQDVINALDQGKPVVALIRVPGYDNIHVPGTLGNILGALGANGGYTLPALHWIAVNGFNAYTGTIYYVDTNGYEYQESVTDFWNSYEVWSFGTIPNLFFQAFGVVPGTFIS